MALDPKLLEILACPEDKGPLLYFEDEAALYNPRLKRRYRVQDDIPIMLIDEAETVDDAEHEPPHREGRARRREADVRGRERRRVGHERRLAATFSTRSAGCPSSSRPRTKPPGASTPGTSRRRDEIDNIVVLGMGGSGIVGRRARDGRSTTSCRSRSSC